MDTDSFFKKIGHHSVNFNKIYRTFILNGLKPSVYINLDNGGFLGDIKMIFGLDKEVLKDEQKYAGLGRIIQRLENEKLIKEYSIIHLPKEPLGENFIDFEKVNNPKNRKNMFADDYGGEIEDYHGLKIDISFSHHNYLDKHWDGVDKNSFFKFFVRDILKIDLEKKN